MNSTSIPQSNDLVKEKNWESKEESNCCETCEYCRTKIKKAHQYRKGKIIITPLYYCKLKEELVEPKVLCNLLE